MKSINENYILIEYIRHSLANEALNLESEENLNEGLSDFLKRKSSIALITLSSLIGTQLPSIAQGNPLSDGARDQIEKIADRAHVILTPYDMSTLDELYKLTLIKHGDSVARDGLARHFMLAALKKGFSREQVKSYLASFLKEMVVVGKRGNSGEYERGEINIGSKNSWKGANEAVSEITNILMTDEYKEIRDQLSKKYTSYYKYYEDFLLENSNNEKQLEKIFEFVKHAANTFKKRDISADSLYCFVMLISGDTAEYETFIRKNLSGVTITASSDFSKSSFLTELNFFFTNMEGLKKSDKIKEMERILESPHRLTAVVRLLSTFKALTKNHNSGKFLKAMAETLKPIKNVNTMNRDTAYLAKQKKKRKK